MHTFEIPLTKGYVAIVDEEDYERVSAFKWYAQTSPTHNSVYAKRERLGRAILMHRFILDAPPGIGVDHRDGDGLNCRRGNLRLATNSQNSHNSRRASNNTSGYKGVTFHKQMGKWQAYITVNSKAIYLGIFAKIEDAAEAYRQAAVKYHGDFARFE